MAHLWDACKPLSVLCCRLKVSAEAVCQEKVPTRWPLQAWTPSTILTGVVKYLVTLIRVSQCQRAQ